MNRMLVVVFDTESAAEAGTRALRQLHADGSITLYAMGVIAKDRQGVVSVRHTEGLAPEGAAVGLAVGSLIGLLGGPAGVVVGGVSGAVVGALRDFWVAGVGMDFVEEAEAFLQPGKVAVVAEVEEEWVVPVDSRLEAAGGVVLRSTRADHAEAELAQDIALMEADIAALKAEAGATEGEVQARVLSKLTAANSRLHVAMDRARQRVEAAEREARAKLDSLQAQYDKEQGAVRTRLDERMKRLRNDGHERGAKLKQAWGLTKQALSL